MTCLFLLAGRAAIAGKKLGRRLLRNRFGRLARSTESELGFLLLVPEQCTH